MGRYSLATLFGVGLVKHAPGTAGSAVAALLAYFILPLPFSWVLLAGGVFIFTKLGARSAAAYMNSHGTDHDPSEIVVDELAGQWLTYVVAFLLMRGIECSSGPCAQHFLEIFPNLPLAIFLGFACFRLFDIWKPWPISLADRKVKGGFGVMFDDLVAAIPAGILMAFLFPMVVMFFL